MTKRNSKPWPKCRWQGCKDYALPEVPVEFCTAHLSIITLHGWRNTTVREKVIEMGAEPPTEKPTRTPRPTTGHIYFLLSNGYIKIGWTSDLDARMKAYDPAARILAVKPGTKQDESQLHKKFAHLRTNRREWFANAPQVMEEAERIVATHGEPPRDLNEPMTTKKVTGPRLTNYIGGDRVVPAARTAKVVRG